MVFFFTCFLVVQHVTLLYKSLECFLDTSRSHLGRRLSQLSTTLWCDKVAMCLNRWDIPSPWNHPENKVDARDLHRLARTGGWTSKGQADEQMASISSSGSRGEPGESDSACPGTVQVMAYLRFKVRPLSFVVLLYPPINTIRCILHKHT